MANNASDIFSCRLRQARLMKGLSMEKLSQALRPSVSRQAINKYEKGMMKPDSRILIALAKALDVKIDYFFRPFTVEVDKVEFRKKSGFTEKMVIAVKERVREALERYLEIEQLTNAGIDFTLPRKTIVDEDEARAFANEIRTLMGLGRDGISNVIDVLEENGVKVIEIDDNDAFDGLSGYANGCTPLIVVNANLSAERKRFVALHELGHLLMDVAEADAIKSNETICNAFASEILLPSEVLISRIGESRHDISLAELIDMQRQFGIAIEDIMTSLCEHYVISERRYSVFHSKVDDIPEFRELVNQSRVAAECSGRFVRMVYRALADETISSSKAAVLLNTSVEAVISNLQLV